jgi:hypothetical protein
MKFYRGSSEIKEVLIDDKTQFKNTLQGENLIQANFVLDSFFDFKIGDYVNWRNKRYTIFKQPSVDKDLANKFVYNFDLESDQYRLIDSLYMLDGEADFPLVGSIEKFANLIIFNLNRLAGDGYYQLGEVPETEVKNITFQNYDCLKVLQKIAIDFELEYEFSDDGRTIDFKEKIGSDPKLSFEFKNGLRTIKRQKVNDKNIITRLYSFGGERNISKDYGSKKLKIDVLEKNTELFGKIEGVVNFDEVYPHREGVVSSIDSENILKFTDTSLDFDINSQLIEGTVAKVTFNSGYLAGYELEIHSYSHASKEFEIIIYSDVNSLEFPNETLKIQPGDTYVLHDIIMPDIYVTNAETILLEKAQSYLDENSLPNVVYAIQPDYTYLRKYLIQLNVGDLIEIKDKDFGITYKTRIISLIQSIANPYKYSITVGDKATVGYITQVRNNQIELGEDIRIEREDRTVQLNRVRKKLKNIDELKDAVFDPDGYFDINKIKPLSIETGMLSVGSKGQQFIIRNFLIEANYQGNENKVKCGDGNLAHFTIDSDNVKEWSLTGNIITLDTPASFYYIYAKCSKTLNTGLFELSTTQYQTNEDDYYYFLIGVIHSVIDDVRGVSLTYGQTTINGKFITTGKIQSTDGYNYLDLDNNKFSLGNANSGIDWNVTNENILTIKGGIVQRSSGESGVIPVFMGVWSAFVTYSLGDQVTYLGSTYNYINNNNSSNQSPNNTSYWEISAAAGQNGNDGTQGVPGENGTNGVTTYTWIKYANDVNGSDISNSPTGKDYIGFAYNKTTAIESNIQSDYSWSKIVGAQGNQGAQGDDGANGQTHYTWIKYSDNSDGTGLYDTPTANSQYIGISVNNTIQTESSDKADYVWSKFKGEDGTDGADGSVGPSIVYRGVFNQTTIYYNNDIRRDVVKYTDDIYYIYKGTNSVALAWSSSNWETFGAQFDSVATKLLLAENANIADWIIKDGKITSQNEYDGNPRAQLDGANGKLTLRSPKTIYNANNTTSEVEQILEIDSINGRVKASHAGNATQEPGETILDSEGLSVNYAGINVSDPTTLTMKAGVVGNVKGKMNADNWSPNHPLVGVYGRAQNTDSNPSEAFGGYFYNLLVKGLIFNSVTTQQDRTIIETDVFIKMINTVSKTVYLPNYSTSKGLGRILFIKATSANVTIDGNGKNLWLSSSQSYTVIQNGHLAILIYDGIKWNFNKVGW